MCNPWVRMGGCWGSHVELMFSDDARSGQVCGHTPEQCVAASICDSVWPSPKQTAGPPRLYFSDRSPHDADMKPVDAPSTWFSHSEPATQIRDPSDDFIHPKNFFGFCRHRPWWPARTECTWYPVSGTAGSHQLCLYQDEAAWPEVHVPQTQYVRTAR